MAEDTHNLSALPHEDRLHLLRFVCSFAWADLEIADSEREFVTALVDRLDLDDADADRAAACGGAVVEVGRDAQLGE